MPPALPQSLPEEAQTCAFFECYVARVLSSAKIGTASWRYYQREVTTDPTQHFLAHREAPGRWWGRGLREVGLTAGDVVAERELEALLARGLHPQTGVALGRAWRRDGVTGYDLTFSAPKSVRRCGLSAGLLSVQRSTRRTGRQCGRHLDFLDTHAALSRKGIDGTIQIDTAGLAAAIFDHRTSRVGDPQLHSHALVVNKLRCADGAWRTIDGREIYHHKKAAGALYQAALRGELGARGPRPSPVPMWWCRWRPRCRSSPLLRPRCARWWRPPSRPRSTPTRPCKVGTARTGTTARRSDTRWATAELLATEAQILRLAQAGAAAGRAVVPEPVAAHHSLRGALDPEQRNAMEQLVTGGQMVAVLIAPAGAGKTTTVGAAVAAWTAAGYQTETAASPRSTRTCSATSSRQFMLRCSSGRRWYRRLNR